MHLDILLFSQNLSNVNLNIKIPMQFRSNDISGQLQRIFTHEGRLKDIKIWSDEFTPLTDVINQCNKNQQNRN